MSLADDPRPPLADWITDAYTVLSTHMTDEDTGSQRSPVPAIDRDRAIELLRTSDSLAVESGDANYAITRLIERGYLYEVDTELRLTSPPDHQ